MLKAAQFPIFAGLTAVFLLAACSRDAPLEAPPMAQDAPPEPSETSIMSVAVDADAALLRRLVEREIPRTLWRINQRFDRCVPKKRVKILGRRINVTPKLGCRVVGKVTRGAIRLRGEGEDIIAHIPLRATVSARDVGGILKSETATGSATVQARIRLHLADDWSPRASVQLRYNWTKTPGIDFLGRRIRFTQQADKELKPVIRSLERELPRELAKLRLRPKIERLWKHGFATMSLNAENPPVWMRVTPAKIHYGGYTMRKGRIVMNLGLEALTQTSIGERPENPEPTPLPPPSREKIADGFNLFMPVVADYAELEPVILSALKKREKQPFELPAVGPMIAKFDSVKAYGTTDNRIAVGVALSARLASDSGAPAKGMVWLVATPRNEAGSAAVYFDDVNVSGHSDGIGTNLLIDLAELPSFSEPIAGALQQNFSNDLENLEGKVRGALAEQRHGPLRIRTQVDGFEIGELRAYGKGVYLPVRAGGKAAVRYLPR